MVKTEPAKAPRIDSIFPASSRAAQAPGALRPGALSHLPTNSPQKAGTRPARETVRRSNRTGPSVRYYGDGSNDDSDCSLPEEESEDEKPTASKAKKRKKPTSSKGKKPRKSLHAYRPVDSRYAAMTTARLLNEGHIATGSFSYNHPLFAEEAAAFNDFKVDGKPVWQKQPAGPSTLHNSVVLADRFPSLAPFLGLVEKLCKPRPTTERLFIAQRAQQYTTSGRRHRDRKNGPWRFCVTLNDPAAPSNIKQLEIGVADASKAEGGTAINPFQTKADGTPDSRRFDCPSGSYHLMDKVATGTVSHAHHQAIIDEPLLPEFGALTTLVIDLDPTNPDTFIEDVAEIARDTAGVVGAGVSAYVPPPSPEQIGDSCYGQKWRDWNELQKEENLETYLQDRREGERTGGAASSGVDCSQVGAATNFNLAAKLRRDIPGATKTRGLCLGLNAQNEGLAANLLEWIDPDTGAIREGAPLCGTPKFGEDGHLTRGKSTWEEDDNGDLVLGYHNGNFREGKTPRCYASTIPVVMVGEKWLVPEWVLRYIREGKVVQKNTNNQRHNGAPEKQRAKKNAWKQ